MRDALADSGVLDNDGVVTWAQDSWWDPRSSGFWPVGDGDDDGVRWRWVTTWEVRWQKWRVGYGKGWESGATWSECREITDRLPARGVARVVAEVEKLVSRNLQECQRDLTSSSREIGGKAKTPHIVARREAS